MAFCFHSFYLNIFSLLIDCDISKQSHGVEKGSVSSLTTLSPPSKFLTLFLAATALPIVCVPRQWERHRWSPSEWDGLRQCVTWRGLELRHFHSILLNLSLLSGCQEEGPLESIRDWRHPGYRRRGILYTPRLFVGGSLQRSCFNNSLFLPHGRCSRRVRFRNRRRSVWNHHSL